MYAAARPDAFSPAAAERAPCPAADETDVRVPFFARGPGIAPGTKLPQLISNVDLAPTLCDLAGVAPPTLMDGRSLAPLLVAGRAAELTRPWRTHFMIEFAEGYTQRWPNAAIWTTDKANPTYDDSSMPPYGFDAAANASCQTSASCPANPCASAEACPHTQRSDYIFDDDDYNSPLGREPMTFAD